MRLPASHLLWSKRLHLKRMKPDLKKIKPYGDTLNDGKVQFSFTLPVPSGPEGKEAARQIVLKMGISNIDVVFAEDLGEGFSFYVVYGTCEHDVDYTRIRVPKVQTEKMDFYQVNRYIKEKIGHKLMIVGACTGTDAHTVGLDAIMSMKGYAGDYGLERYSELEVYNMGSQVPNSELIAKAIDLKADAILVSQVVTQKDIHLKNLTEFTDMAEVEGLADRTLLIIGGPRISHELATELGFDAGFGPGTLPSDVASFICTEIVRRRA